MSVSAEGAWNYFDVALKKSDYYAKQQGVWGGKGAERLGLKAKLRARSFSRSRPTRRLEPEKI